MSVTVGVDNILQGPPALYEPAPGGIGCEVFRSMKLHKEKIAQYHITSGEAVTYENLLTRSVRVAIYLQKKNLKKEDTICMCSNNDINSSVPLLAAKFAGLNYASIEPTIPEDDLIYLLNYLEPKVLFISDDSETKIENCLKKSNLKCDLVVIGKSAKYVTFSELMVESHEEKTFRPVFVEDLKETAIIFLSSGTTGKPKGICLNHYSFLSQCFIVLNYFHRKGVMNFSNFIYKYEGKEENKFMFYSPMYWISGCLMSLGLIFCGGTKVFGSAFDVKEAWEAVEKCKPDTLFLPPGQVNELCAYGANKQPDTNLNSFMTGGGLVTPAHLANIKKCFINAKVVQAYGQTENSGTLATYNIDDPSEMEMQNSHPECCGRISTAVLCRVVDIETEKICKPGEPGELRVKNKYIMNGYYKMDSSSEFDADGWFKTGDLVHFDENGYIFVIDRLKELLLYTVFNIRPSVIEKILFKHPAVLECIVVGVPHPTDNEHPMGVAVLEEEHKNKVTEDELVAYVNENVPSDRYKIRAGIRIVDHMIRSPNGKLKKFEMKRLIIEGKTWE